MALVPFPDRSAAGQLSDSKPPIDFDDEGEATGGKMSFLEHLDELRKRLVVTTVSVAVGFVVSCLFLDRIVAFILVPLNNLLPPGSHFMYTEPAEFFLIKLKIAALAGLLLASPVVMSQVWLFIAPGLYAHEKRFAIPFIFLSTVCFVAGALFSHYMVFPWAWKFFANFTNDYVTYQPRIQSTFALYSKMLLAFGVIFELPTLVYFLARMGLVTARFLLKKFKYAVLIIFIVAAILTPTPDLVTQCLMAGPMIVLYLLSVVIAWMVGKRAPSRSAEL